MKRLILPIALWLSLAILLPESTLASNIIPSDYDKGILEKNNASLNGALNTLWGRLTTIIFLILGGLAVLMLILASIQYITAGNSADKTKRARQNIINVILGIILLICAYTIIGLALGLVGYFARQAG